MILEKGIHPKEENPVNEVERAEIGNEPGPVMSVLVVCLIELLSRHGVYVRRDVPCLLR
jgi:hypothetical protein